MSKGKVIRNQQGTEFLMKWLNEDNVIQLNSVSITPVSEIVHQLCQNNKYA